MIKIKITENESDQRLDRFLKKFLKRAPLSMLYKMIRKDIKINGRRGREDTVLRTGDELTFYISEEKLEELSASVRGKTLRRQFKTVYEDENILVVGKPWGLLTHGDSHEKKNTLVNQVCGYLQEKGEYDPSRERSFSPAPVNRLDRNTTGLVLFGKTSESLRILTKAIRERSNIKKYYLTIVSGFFDEPMKIESRLLKDSKSNTVNIPDENIPEEQNKGKVSYTIVRTVARGKEFSLVEAELITGRTHQIRAHLSKAGFPLIGDAKYGSRLVNDRVKHEFGLTTQLLHAYKLEFFGFTGKFSYLNGKIIQMSPPADFIKVRDAVLQDTKV